MGKAAIINCPFESCKETFKQEPKLFEHLKKVHNVNDPKLHYINLYCNGKHPVCNCDDINCRRALEWFGWRLGFASKFLRGHNIKKDDAPIKSEEILAKASQSRLGQVPWNKNKTKEDDERVAEAAKNISKGLQKAYGSGRVTP